MRPSETFNGWAAVVLGLVSGVGSVKGLPPPSTSQDG
jgi:hypothetical protein